MAENAQAALDALFACRTIDGFRDILEAHPFLLDPVVADSIERNTAAVTDPGIRNTIDRVLWILQKCRAEGIDAWHEQVAPMRDLVQHLADKAARPRDVGKAPAERDEDVAEAPNTLAAMAVVSYRGTDHPHDSALHEKIRAAGEDHYLALLAKLTTNGDDWAEEFAKIVQGQRAEAMKYMKALAARYPQDPALARVGFEFTHEKIPNAFALRIADDDSVAIGVDPALQGLFANLFHVAQVAVAEGDPQFFIGLLTDLVTSHYLDGYPATPVEGRLLNLYSKSDPFQRRWADWSGPVAMRFLVGHEMGHIHLRHLDHCEAPRVAMLPGNSDSELTAFDHQTEFEADAWSARALITGAKDVSESIVVRTLPAIFMQIMAMIEDLYAPHDPIGRIQRDTHPPPAERAGRLLAIGKEGLRDDRPIMDVEERLWQLPEAIAAIHASRDFQDIVARASVAR